MQSRNTTEMPQSGNIIYTNISSFYDIDNQIITYVDVSNNQIVNFEGIKMLRNIETLIANNTGLCSFKGADNLQKLKLIDIRNTPLSRKFYLHEMVLFAFGFSVCNINGEEVNDLEKRLQELYDLKEIQEKIRKGAFLFGYPDNNKSVNEYVGFGIKYRKTVDEEKQNLSNDENKIYNLKLLLEKIVSTTNTLKGNENINNNNIKYLERSYFNENDELKKLIIRAEAMKKPKNYDEKFNKLLDEKKMYENDLKELENEIEELNACLENTMRNLKNETENNLALRMKLNTILNLQNCRNNTNTDLSFKEQFQKIRMKNQALSKENNELQTKYNSLKEYFLTINQNFSDYRAKIETHLQIPFTNNDLNTFVNSIKFMIDENKELVNKLNTSKEILNHLKHNNN